MSALAEALVAAQAELPCALGKDATGQIGNRDYRYLTLDKLIAETRPILTKYGLSIVQFPGEVERHLGVDVLAGYVEDRGRQSRDRGLAAFDGRQDDARLGRSDHVCPPVCVGCGARDRGRRRYGRARRRGSAVLMPKARYGVHAVTGYTISPSGRNSGGAKPTTSYAVLDSAYCYSEVANFRPSGNGHPPGRVLEQRAADLCARLNAEDRADAA